MSKAPAIGLCIPVTIASETFNEGITDGDTVRVHRSGSDLHFPVRLLGCWAPETKIRGNAVAYDQAKKMRIVSAGRIARDGLVQLLGGQSKEIRLHVSFDIIKGKDITDLITMGRILGELWVINGDVSGDVNVSTWMCERGYARATKEELEQAGLC